MWSYLFKRKHPSLLLIKICSLIFLLSPELMVGQLTLSTRWINEFSKKYDAKLNIVYNKIDTIENKLDIYIPKDTSNILPALLWFHGGGWRKGTKDSISGQLKYYLEKGWVVVNVDYRLTDVALAPAAVVDCRCALHWIVKNAQKYHIDIEKIVLSGTSAGGHLALITGMLPVKNPLDTICSNDLKYRIAAIINWYGITDVGDLLSGINRKGYAVKWLGDQSNHDEIAKQVSPLTYIRKDLPPIFSVHGDADTTVPYTHAVRLHKTLSDSGVPNRMVTISGGRHGKFSEKENEDIYEAIDEFLLENNIERKK
jgi:acetyl esterase/lipase